MLNTIIRHIESHAANSTSSRVSSAGSLTIMVASALLEAFHAASHKALVNEKVELQRSMLAMQTNYAREISESKGLANEVEDMMVRSSSMATRAL